MKKVLTLALSLLVVGAVSAQKQVVDQAKKLAGKTDKIEEARSLIKQAIANPETKDQVLTYYVAGKIENDAYDKAKTSLMINPNDDKIDQMAMYEELINGYNYFMQALPFDSLPNEKGQVKPKYSKDMIANINANFNDFFNAGGFFYNNKKYYPEAYTAFMIYGNMPSWENANKVVAAMPDSILNTAFFNAGLSAYAGGALPESAKAFKSARLRNSDNPQNYIYELACWQFMAQKDSTIENEAKKNIEEIALAGYKKFGTSQMLFVNNLINAWVNEGQEQKALDMIGGEINANPNNGALYGLQGYIYDRLHKDSESVDAYKKAASFNDTDASTLKEAAKKIYKVGTEKFNELQPADKAGREQVKKEYFEAAKDVVERAKIQMPDDGEINYLLENIDYALTTYF